MTTFFDEYGRPKVKVAKDALTNTWYVAEKQMILIGRLNWVIVKGGFPSERAALNYAKEKFGVSTSS